MFTRAAVHSLPQNPRVPRVLDSLRWALVGSLLLHGAAMAWMLREAEPVAEEAVPLVQVAILEVPRTSVPAEARPPEPVRAEVPRPVAVQASEGRPKPEPVPEKRPEPEPEVIPQEVPRSPIEAREVTPPDPDARLAPAARREPAPAAVTPPAFEADYLENPPPAYPRLSRRLREEGEVELRVRVSPAGEALAVELARSSGSGRLDQAALQAVRSWRFEPARRGAQAVEAWVRVPILFKLEA